MQNKRTDRINSLLREILAQIIQREVKNPNLSPLTSISQVDISRDLSFARVYVNAIGTPEEKQKTLNAIIQARSFISHTASQKVRLRIFPTLRFYLDTSADKQMHIDAVLEKLESNKKTPPLTDDSE
jgi:ribosome-binding factor A